MANNIQKFAKLVDTEEYGQVLLMTLYNDEAEQYELRFMVNSGNLTIQELRWGFLPHATLEDIYDYLMDFPVEGIVEAIGMMIERAPEAWIQTREI
ncbi:MAG: hypothetical protein AB7E48_00425 [Deferribacterales bacterium]